MSNDLTPVDFQCSPYWQQTNYPASRTAYPGQVQNPGNQFGVQFAPGVTNYMPNSPPAYTYEQYQYPILPPQPIHPFPYGSYNPLANVPAVGLSPVYGGNCQPPVQGMLRQTVGGSPQQMQQMYQPPVATYDPAGRFRALHSPPPCARATKPMDCSVLPDSGAIYSHRGVLANRNRRTVTRGVFIDEPASDLCSTQFDTSLWSTPIEEMTQNKVSVGVMHNPYSNQSFEVFENLPPPPNTNRGAIDPESLKRISPKLLWMSGGVNPHLPARHKQEVYNDVFANGGANPWGSQAYTTAIQNEMKERAERTLWHNRNESMPCEQGPTREAPAGYFGLVPRNHIIEYSPPKTFDGNMYGYMPATAEQPNDLARRPMPAMQMPDRPDFASFFTGGLGEGSVSGQFTGPVDLGKTVQSAREQQAMAGVFTPAAGGFGPSPYLSANAWGSQDGGLRQPIGGMFASQQHPVIDGPLAVGFVQHEQARPTPEVKAAGTERAFETGGVTTANPAAYWTAAEQRAYEKWLAERSFETGGITMPFTAPAPMIEGDLRPTLRSQAMPEYTTLPDVAPVTGVTLPQESALNPNPAKEYLQYGTESFISGLPEAMRAQYPEFDPTSLRGTSEWGGNGFVSGVGNAPTSRSHDAPRETRRDQVGEAAAQLVVWGDTATGVLRSTPGCTTAKRGLNPDEAYLVLSGVSSNGEGEAGLTRPDTERVGDTRKEELPERTAPPFRDTGGRLDAEALKPKCYLPMLQPQGSPRSIMRGFCA